MTEVSDMLEVDNRALYIVHKDHTRNTVTTLCSEAQFREVNGFFGYVC